MKTAGYKNVMVLFTIILILPVWARCENRDFCTVIPELSSGKCEIPMIYSYDRRGSLLNDAKCQAAFDDKNLYFFFMVPKSADYNPNPRTGHDSRIWGDDSVEVFLHVPESKKSFQWMVNIKGKVYDKVIADGKPNVKWDTSGKIEVKVAKKYWLASFKIPMAEMGIDPSAGDAELFGNVCVRSFEPGKELSQLFAPTTMNISFANDWGIFILSKSLPFADKFSAETIRKKDRFWLKSMADIKSQKAVTHIRENNRFVELPAGQSRTVTFDKELRGTRPIVFDYFPGLSMTHDFEKPEHLLDVKAVDIDHLNIKWGEDNNYFSTFHRAIAVIDNTVIYDGPAGELEKTLLDISEIPEGRHLLHLSFFVRGNREVREKFDEEIFTIRPTPIDYNLADLDVSEYYKPVASDETSVKAARSEFDFSEGPLPRQVRIDGRDLLSGPVTIFFNGKPFKFEKPLILFQNNNLTTVTSKSMIENGRQALLEAQVFYDGFIWYRLKIRGRKLNYGPLCLRVPVGFTDPLYSHQTIYPDSSFSKDSIKDSGSETAIKTPGYDSRVLGRCAELTEKEKSIPLTCYVSVATDKNRDYRGVSFLTEGPRGWNMSNYDKTYHLEKGKDDTVLTVNFSDGKKKISTEEIAVEFGLQTFPLREYNIRANFDWRVNYCPLFMTYWKYLNLNSQNKPVSLAQHMADKRQTVACIFQEWTESQSYWKTSHDLMMQKTSQAVHDSGMLLTAYFGFQMANTIPEFRLYHDMFMRKPSTYPSGGYRRRGWCIDRGFASEKMRAWDVSYAGVWGDRMLRGIEEAVRRYDLDGLYFDGTLLPFASFNPAEGQGVIDPWGRRIVTWDVLNKRRFVEIIYGMGKKLGKDKWFLDLHTNMPQSASISLISLYHTAEAAHLFDHRARLDSAKLRGQLNGELYGVPCDMYLRPPYKVKWGFAQSLLTNTFLRLNSGGPKVWTESCSKIWKIWDDYNLLGNYFVPFFEAEKNISRSNQDIRLSYFDTGKNLVVVVSNYWQDTPQDVELDLAKFSASYDLAGGRDIWEGAKININGAKCSLNIPAENFRLLVFDKQK